MRRPAGLGRGLLRVARSARRAASRRARATRRCRARWPKVAGPMTAAAPDAAGTEPLWELGIGVAGFRFDDYRGSDHTNTTCCRCRSSPTAAAFLRADRDGARAILFAGRPGHRRRQPRRVGADREQGQRRAQRHAATWRRRSRSAPASIVELWQVEHRQAQARPAPAGARGDHARAFAARDRPHLLAQSQPRHRRLAGQAGTSGCSPGRCSPTAATTSYFYSVAPEFATATRPAYEAPGGYAGWRAIAAFSRRFGNAWLGAFVRYDDLHGAVFAPSPLVRQRNHSHRRLRHLMDLRDFEPARTDRRLSGEAAQVAGARSPRSCFACVIVQLGRDVARLEPARACCSTRCCREAHRARARPRRHLVHLPLLLGHRRAARPDAQSTRARSTRCATSRAA